MSLMEAEACKGIQSAWAYELVELGAGMAVLAHERHNLPTY